MLNIDIKYNAAVDFLFSIVRINFRSIIRNNKYFINYEYNDEIEAYVKNVVSTMSPMMQNDFEILTKRFTAGINVPVYMCLKNNITSIPHFLNYFDKITGEDFFRIYEEYLGIDSSTLTKAEFNHKMKEKFKEMSPPTDYKIYFDLDQHKEETKNRLFNLFNNYYLDYYKSVEDQTYQFMKQRVSFYSGINPSDRSYFMSTVLLINADNIDPNFSNIVLYPSYFYEIGWSQLICNGTLAYVFGYLLEQQLDSSFEQKRCEEFRKILSDDKRIEIIKLLDKKKCYSSELAALLNVSKANISYHINKMLSIGLLNMEFEPSNRTYLSLNRKALKQMLDSIYDDITSD